MNTDIRKAMHNIVNEYGYTISYEQQPEVIPMHFKILFKLEQTALEKESEKTDQKKVRIAASYRYTPNLTGV